MFIDDLHDIVNFHICLFAEDNAMYIIADVIQDCNNVEYGFTSSQYLGQKWQIKLICLKQRLILLLQNLYFDGQEVNEVKSHKHLVVLFSSALSWNAFSKIFTFLSCSCANTFCLYSALLIL